MMKAGNKKNMGATLKRLIAYVLKQYKWQCLLVALCILVSTAANIGGTLFMRNLIDDYILPFCICGGNISYEDSQSR